MPQYITSPFKPSPALLVAGSLSYVYGSYNDRTGPTLGTVLTNAAVTTTATLVFQILSGNIPFVGSKISVRGTANSAGVFNVTNGTILSVSCTDAGVCTVTYAISSTSQGTTVDHGEVQIPQPEIGETMTNGASVPVAAPFNNPNINQGRTVTATVTFPTSATTGIVYLQGAMVDIDDQYEDIAVVGGVGSQSVLGPNVAVADLAYRFYRLRCGSVTGSGTIVGKIS